MSPKQCSKCGERSVPELRPGFALCQYHYNALIWGKGWADECKKADDRLRAAKEKAR
jgi:hypothetical protein